MVLRRLTQLMPEGIGLLIHQFYVQNNQLLVFDWAWFDRAGVPANYSLVSSLQDNLSDSIYQDVVRNNLLGLLHYEDRNNMHFSVES